MSAPADQKQILQVPKERAAAPAARRSVSFGPSSISPPPNGGMPTILDQTSMVKTDTSADSVAGSNPGNARRVASAFGTHTGRTSMPGSASMTPTGSTTTALKPALKQGTERKRLPPPSQYQHPDPLLRRLRLVDDKGSAVSLKELFKGVKVVAFYFSSQWAGQPLKEYHSTISEFAREHQHEFKVVYVSVDVDEQWYKAGVKGQPWVSMVWNDGSSLPSPSTTNATSPSANETDDELPPLYNSEDFLLAQETDIDESLAKTDTAGEAYLRPFSRVHLASKLNIIAAPTVCIYSVERQKMLDWNVRMARLQRSQRDETWSRWKRGESAKSFGFTEALANSPGTMILIGFATLYWLLLFLGGQDYNFLRKAMEGLSPGTKRVADSAALSGGPPAGNALTRAVNDARQHVEF